MKTTPLNTEVIVHDIKTLALNFQWNVNCTGSHLLKRHGTGFVG